MPPSAPRTPLQSPSKRSAQPSGDKDALRAALEPLREQLRRAADEKRQILRHLVALCNSDLRAARAAAMFAMEKTAELTFFVLAKQRVAEQRAAAGSPSPACSPAADAPVTETAETSAFLEAFGELLSQKLAGQAPADPRPGPQRRHD
jgi:hypothetical protein